MICCYLFMDKLHKLKHFISNLRDLPITFDNRDLFVDRKKILNELNICIELYKGSIIGVTGERGIGKTSIFNYFTPEYPKLKINIKNRETKLGVLKDITYAFILFTQDNGMHNASKKLKQILNNIDIREKESLSAGISTIISLNLLKEKEKRLDITNIIDELKSVLEYIVKRTNLVVILDEIDKEEKSELLLILDAIKDCFLDNEITLFVALPGSFSSEYRLSREDSISTYNLENVLKKIIEINILNDTDLFKLVNLRTNNDLHKFIDKAGLDLLTFYANGNPRKFILGLKESGFNAVVKNHSKIIIEDVKNTITPYLKDYLISLKLTETEKNILNNIKDAKLSDLIKILESKGYSRQLAHKYIKRLNEKKIIEIIGKDLFLNYKIKLCKSLNLI